MNALEARIQRLEDTVGTLAAWLASAQTGFSRRDYVAIEKFIRESQDAYYNDRTAEQEDGQ
jgi:hypothetical protein